MAKKTKKNNGSATLKKINAEAKKIHNKHPRKKWTTCISEASKKVKK